MSHILKFKDYKSYNEELFGIFGDDKKSDGQKPAEDRVNLWIESTVNQSLEKQGSAVKAVFNAQKGTVVIPLLDLNISILCKVREDLLENAEAFLEQNKDIESSELGEYYDNWADSMFNSVKNANNGPLSWSEKSRKFYSSDSGKSQKIKSDEVYQKYYKD